MTFPIILPNPQIPEDTVLVQYYDYNLNVLGMIQWATVTMTINYNMVGSWSVVLPYTDALWNQMMSGDFIVLINWRGLFEFGGKVETPAYSSSVYGAASGGSAAAAPGGSSGEFITLSGGDFLQILANRICYPDPTKTWANQTAKSADLVVSGIPLETAIKHYVSVNVGSGAISSRVHPLLDIATDQRRGPNVSYAVVFNSSLSLNLMDVIRAMIAQAYPTPGTSQMGVRITRNGQRLLFDCYYPTDKTGTVVFSEQLGNLTSVNFSLTDPTCTDALTQGATPMLNSAGNPTSDNPFNQQTASGKTAWNMTEVYVNQISETDINRLKAEGANQLTSNGWGPTLATTVTDTPYCVYGRDFSVGDIVSVEVRPTDIYKDIVSSATLTADPTQTPSLSVVPTIGNSNNSAATNPTINNQLIARIRAIEKLLGK